MNIKFYDRYEFSNLKEDWNKLENGGEMTAFQAYSWYNSLNELYKTEKLKNVFRDWFYVVAYENEEPIMIAPLQYVKIGISYKGIFGIDRGIYFIGRQGYTDYCNFIYSEFRIDALECILDAVQNNLRTNFFCFEFLIDRTSAARYIKEKYAEPYGYTSCADLILPEKFEEYTASLSKSIRQNIRTAFNRQKRDNIVFTHKLSCEPLDIKTRDTIMEIRAGRVRDKQNNAKKRMTWKGRMVEKYNKIVSAVFSKQHNIMYQALNSWCFLVMHGDDIAGFFWGIKDITDTKYYVIYAGVDEKYAWYSPTLSHFYSYIEGLYENEKQPKISVFDFTRGGEKYKKDMGCSLKNGLSFRFKRKAE